MHPVLLVHGINDTGARFDKMRRVLEARGFEPVSAMNITPSDGSISLEAMAEQVNDCVSALSETANDRRIDVVAFSMGALAARYAVQRLGGRSSVRRFVSVSAPHHGTVNAYFSWKAGTKQMRPGSRFLRDLNDGGGEWGDVAVFSFWSPLDMVVIPASSSRLDGADNRTFRVAFHHWMPSDDRVIEAVIQVLASED